MESELAADIAIQFAEQEGAAFLTGNGTDKPKGLLDHTQSEEADGTRAFGTLQCLKTGVADGFKASHPAHDPVDLIQKSRTEWERSG